VPPQFHLEGLAVWRSAWLPGWPASLDRGARRPAGGGRPAHDLLTLAQRRRLAPLGRPPAASHLKRTALAEQ